MQAPLSEKIVRYLLIATALTPLLAFRSSLFFPYAWSKSLFFRVIVELAAAIFFLCLLSLLNNRQSLAPFGARLRRAYKEPAGVALVTFWTMSLLSALYAENRFHAFWGDVERGDGLFNLFHLIAFFLLTLLVFRKEDWLLFFKATVGVGAIVVLFAWFQKLGIIWVPFALTPSARPGSFLGNPAFLGAYLIFLLAATLLVIERTGKTAWRWALWGMAILCAGTLFIIEVRGALVGVFAAFLILALLEFFSPPTESFKKYARFVLLAFVACASLVWLTRGSGLWDAVPGVGRLLSIGPSDPTTNTRILALQVSWEAFKERPVLGWGLENYTVAFNKHYAPELARYGDTWFDRPHNKAAEVAVSQGIAGLVAYLAVFAAVAYSLFRKRGKAFSAKGRLVLIGCIVGYFIQNLFAFDSPVSHILFYAILGFILSSGGGEDEAQATINSPTASFSKKAAFVTLPIALIGAAYLIYFTAVVPASQSVLFHKMFADKVGEKILSASGELLEPYTYLQPTLRLRFLEILTANGLMQDARFNPLTSLSLRAVEDVMSREAGYDPRNYLKLAEAYSEKGKQDPEFFKKAELYASRAIQLSPNRQGVYYPLSLSLAGQGKFEEAIRVARETVLLSPSVARAHYNLGLMLALAGKEEWGEALAEFETAEAAQENSLALGSLDMENLSVIYREMIVAYIREKETEKLIRVIGQFKKVRPAVGEQLDLLGDLAEKEDWRALEETVGFPSR